MAESKWLRVSKRRRCEICKRPDWCTYTATVACCMRTPSPRQARNGGWLHWLADTPQPQPMALPAPYSPPDGQPVDWAGLLASWTTTTVADRLAAHAADLGVSIWSLRRLGIAWAAPHRAWAFPMRNPDGTVCGIRLRAESGKKWAVTGSHQGLFIPDKGQIGDQVDQVLVCEGPTDTAAMLDLGFVAIGRPSCSGSVEALAGLLRRRNVVIVSDRDEGKLRPDGTVFFPGQEGSDRLAAALVGGCLSVRIIRPLRGKDAREWVRSGATTDVVRTVIRNRNLVPQYDQKGHRK